MKEGIVLRAFLSFVSEDLNSNPNQTIALDRCFHNNVHTLIAGVDIDLNGAY